MEEIDGLSRDVIKLTALFTARRGRSFLQTLAQKEARNVEFDFLRPTHSLFGYFNSLVEQYSKVLFPPKETLEKLQKGSEEGARWKMLEISRQHAEWEKLKREKEKKKRDDKEAERSELLIQPRVLKSRVLTDSTQLHSLRSTGMTTPSCKQSNSLLSTQLPSYRRP